MKILLFRIAKIAGLFALSRWLTRGGLRILGYHGIWLGEDHYGDFLFMSPEKFAERMAYLAGAGYPVMPLHKAVEALKSGSLPPCATVITIDDGWYGTYSHMLPVLEAHGLPATIYMTTYYAERQYPVFNLLVPYLLRRTSEPALDLAQLDIPGGARIALDSGAGRRKAAETIIDYAERELDSAGRDRLGARLAAALGIGYADVLDRKLFHLMSLDELADTVRRGHDVQLHTERHRLPIDDPQALIREIADNRASLEPVAKRPLRHFSYPSGIYDPRIWPDLEALRIESATTIEQGLNFSGTPLLALKRLLDGQSVELIEFEAELCGFVELLRRLRRPLSLPTLRRADRLPTTRRAERTG